jgi:L-threonylcarbamoyladenylate synthase
MIIVSEDISKAAEILNEENLVAIPTETVYGLAGNIYSEKR